MSVGLNKPEPIAKKQAAQDRFGRYAAGYVTSETHAAGADLDLLVEMAEPQSAWVMLDIATGGGHTALKFAPLVKRVVATDLTPQMLAKAQEFIASQGVRNIEFKPADAENLPFEAKTFDLVTCRIAPHHFPDVPQFIRESCRVLQPGGILLVQDHVLPEDAESARYIDNFERLRDPSHNRAYSQAEWIGLFEAAGLSVTRSAEVIKRHILLDWAKRQGCAAQTIAELGQMLQAAPQIAGDWLAAAKIDTPQGSFANHHILILGRKAP